MLQLQQATEQLFMHAANINSFINIYKKKLLLKEANTNLFLIKWLISKVNIEKTQST